MTAVLRRQLGLTDAVTVGAGSMIGAGVFSAWAPAADAAGTGLLIGLVVAAIVAFCNATSSAQLAALYPESGGTYVYARHQLGPSWGHLAGWAFIVGKTASCVAIALTAGAYLWPEQARLVAVTAVLVVDTRQHRRADTHRHRHQVPPRRRTHGTRRGRRRRLVEPDRLPRPHRADRHVATRHPARRWVPVLRLRRLRPHRHPRRRGPRPGHHHPQGHPPCADRRPRDLRHRRRHPARHRPHHSHRRQRRPAQHSSSPRHRSNGSPRSSESVPASPRSECSSTSCPASHAPCWRWPDATSCPVPLAHVDHPRAIPLRAELVVTAVVIVLTATFDLRGAIGFSGVTILTYYAITNAACLTLPPARRRWPRSIAAIGLVGCVALAVMLPLPAIVVATGILLSGIVVRRIGSAAHDRATSRHGADTEPAADRRRR